MKRHHAQGFTLLEMVVTLATLSLIALIATPYLSTSINAYYDHAVESRILGELRYASERIARELRELRRDPVTPANYDVTSPLVADRITFFRNDGERVTIQANIPRLDLSYLSVQADTPFQLSESLQSLAFSYLQSDEVTTASGGNDLAYIDFEIRLDVNGRLYTQRSRVALRAKP